MLRFLGVCLLIVVAGAAAGAEPKEPEYEGKPLGHWLKELSAKETGQRDRAAQAMIAVLKADRYLDHGRRAPVTCSLLLSCPELVKQHGKELTPVLAARLQDADLVTRLRAAQVLAVIGPDAAAAAPALRTALKDRIWEVRCQAALALAKADPKEVEPMIAFLLKGPGADIPARRCLPSYGKDDATLASLGLDAVPHLVPRLADENAAIRDRVTRALCSMGEPAMAEVIKALSAEKPALRAGAARCLGGMSSKSPALLSALRGALKDGDREVRLTAAEGLGKADADASIQVLVDVLAEGSTEQRARSAIAVRSIGELSCSGRRGAVARLVQQVQAKDGVLDLDVADALVHLAPPQAKQVTALLGRETVTGQDEVQVLVRIGGADPEAVPAIVQALAGILKHPKKGTGQQHAAVQALGKMGPAAKAAVPALLEAVKGKDPNLAKAVARVLPLIDPEATDYPRDLQSLPYNPNEKVRETLSLARAADSLDVTARDWMRTNSCGGCHTHFTYLMARPLVKKGSSLTAETRKFIEEKMEKKSRARFDAEAVSGAAALAFDDARTGKLQPVTRQALDRMWSILPIRSCDTDTIVAELSPDYSAVLAIVAAHVAPEKYAQTEKAKKGLAVVRAYLVKSVKTASRVRLHSQALLLWAASHEPELLTGPEREAIIQSLLAAQRKDGGWSLASLEAARRPSKNNDALSDGYGTGFTVYMLRQAGVPATRPEMIRAVNWLRSNQRDSGRWFTPTSSANQITSNNFGTRELYSQATGTAFALLALDSCGALQRAEPIGESAKK